MKVLMFGWEFPPYSSGGLGTACHGLTKGLSNQNIDVTFVMPKAKTEPEKTHVKLIVADRITNIKNIIIKKVDSLLIPYIDSEKYNERYESYQEHYRANKSSKDAIYSKNLYEEVHRYAKQAAVIADEEEHDIIHCHDWMTYQAGIEAKQTSGKPFVIHVHATEFDRTGGNPNQYIYDIERKGMHTADHIMSVSKFTKNKIVEHYGIPAEKITVVHNAVEFNGNKFDKSAEKIKDGDHVVLFLGRITIQKGPDWFLKAAKRVLEYKNIGYKNNVKFVVAGNGDMEGYMIEEAARMGIADKVLFTGFLRGKDIDRAYSMADLYVMPSISEPFGITPLEAMRNNTPVLISKQSGVSEILDHALKVDFWDIDDMANKIIGVLNYQEAHKCLQENGAKEVMKFDWNNPAKKCIDVYNNVLKKGLGAGA
ncbi:MAG: glycosyltransferase family 4 protein [Candidatus Woesearchaeota archaeon]